MKEYNKGNRLFLSIVYSFMLFAVVITLYPVMYVFSMSISEPIYIIKKAVYLFPKGITLSAYKLIMGEKDFYLGYYNTIIYTVFGTLMNLVATVMAAYPLSRKKFFARKFFTICFLITMFIGGGLIPSFLLINKLGLYNTRWAILLPGLISTYNMILCRTFIQSLPEDVFESAYLDGCSDFRMMYNIVVPLIKPIIAVLVIYYGVGHWNSWFSAMLYLPNDKLHPVQIYLRRLVLLNSAVSDFGLDVGDVTAEGTMLLLQIQYAVIFATSIPILIAYPFLQKYFVKGVMIGSLKG